MILSRIIKEEFAEIKPFELPAVADGAQGSTGITAGELSAIQEEAYAEAFQQGLNQGLAQAEAQMSAQQEQQKEKLAFLENLISLFQVPLEHLDQEVEAELAALVTLLLKQLFRREVKLDPAQIIGVIREAIAVLPINSRQVKLLLHPEDAAIVRTAYSESGKTLEWELVEEASISQGGCRLITPESRIDVTMENRITAMITAAFGGEREQDESSPA